MSGVTTRPVRAGIYCRISRDDEGKEGAGLGVQRQEKDCQKLAARLGWTVIDTFTDNDISAIGKERPRYDDLVAGIASGRIDGVIAWHLDRVFREPLVELGPYGRRSWRGTCPGHLPERGPGPGHRDRPDDGDHLGAFRRELLLALPPVNEAHRRRAASRDPVEAVVKILDVAMVGGLDRDREGARREHDALACSDPRTADGDGRAAHVLDRHCAGEPRRDQRGGGTRRDDHLAGKERHGSASFDGDGDDGRQALTY